ncbi:hypothetical protein GAPWKB30_0095 [Gilliamella apicola]|nr:hypothetical protein GAPWKB30_0095 [Gilliamella apicola]
MLLPYSPNLQALTAHTSNVIEGSAWNGNTFSNKKIKG